MKGYIISYGWRWFHLLNHCDCNVGDLSLTNRGQEGTRMGSEEGDERVLTQMAQNSNWQNPRRGQVSTLNPGDRRARTQWTIKSYGILILMDHCIMNKSGTRFRAHCSHSCSIFFTMRPKSGKTRIVSFARTVSFVWHRRFCSCFRCLPWWIMRTHMATSTDGFFYVFWQRAQSGTESIILLTANVFGW